MKILHYIAAILIFTGSCFANADSGTISFGIVKDKENHPQVLLQFQNINKRIWIINASESDIKFVNPNLPGKISRSGNTASVIIWNDATIRIYKTEIQSIGKDVKINGETMDQELNAVVGSDGIVMFGAFIRNFE